MWESRVICILLAGTVVQAIVRSSACICSICQASAVQTRSFHAVQGEGVL